MKRFFKSFKIIGRGFILLGLALIVLGFVLVNDNSSSVINPLVIVGLVFLFIGIIINTIVKSIKKNVNEGVKNTTETLFGKIKEAIDNQKADNTTTEPEFKAEANDKHKTKETTCPYCNTTYNKTSAKCPGCGAQNK